MLVLILIHMLTVAHDCANADITSENHLSESLYDLDFTAV